MAYGSIFERSRNLSSISAAAKKYRWRECSDWRRTECIRIFREVDHFFAWIFFKWRDRDSLALRTEQRYYKEWSRTEHGYCRTLLALPATRLRTAACGLPTASIQYCLWPHNKATRSKILLVIAQPTCLPDFISIMLSAFCNALPIWNRDLFCDASSFKNRWSELFKKQDTIAYLCKKDIILLNN